MPIVRIPYGIQKKAAIFFLIFYFAAGMYFVDTYPFFYWSLFSVVPNVQKDYTIEIYSIGVRKFDPSLEFSQTKFLFDEIGQSPTQYTQPIYDLGIAIEKGDAESVSRQRKFVEHIFRDQSFRYAVLKVTYDPVEYWKTGTFQSKEKLEEFTSSTKP